MDKKDWILLLVPIFCNGVIIFILQKIFEKRQITKTIKFEYTSIFRQKIDLALELHAKATREASERKDVNETIQQYVNSVLDIYYYYVQNKVIFNSFDKRMEQIASLVLDLIKCSQQKDVERLEFSKVFNKIRDELMILKKECINLRF